MSRLGCPGALGRRASIVCMATVLVAACSRHAAADPQVPCHKCDTGEICDSTTLPPEPPPPPPPVVPFAPTEALTATDLISVALEITPNFTNSTLAGKCTMQVKALQSISVFTIRLHSNFTINTATVGGTAVSVGSPSGGARQVTLDRTYNADEQFTLVLEYSGAPAGAGFGSFTFTTHSGAQICASLSEPYYAYTWWPCKDTAVGATGNNSDKFTLDVKLTVPDTMMAASNGTLEDVTTNGSGQKIFHWVSDYATATYLLSISVTNYQTWSRTYTYPGGSMPVQFFIYPESNTGANTNAWDKVMDMLPAFRGAYGEYPFVDEKYGIYQFPFSGGMEHQTMTGQGGSGGTPFTEYITAHELAHQWWGDMITCKTWGDIWLNEGFATFSEAIWQERKPGGSMAAYHSWMANRRPGNFNGSVYCYNTGSVSAIFDGNNSYRKGGWVLHMLRHLMGDTLFFQALADYRTAFAYQAATTDDFEAICTNVYGQDLSWFFDQWVYEPGAPDYEYGSQAVQINGANYLLMHLRQKQNAAWSTYSMPIDVQYVAGGNTITRQLQNNNWMEFYVLPVPQGAPSNIVLDPVPWVLHPTPTVVSYVPGPPVLIGATPAPGAAVAANTHPRTVVAAFHTDISGRDSEYTMTRQGHGPVSISVSYDALTFRTTLTAASALLPGQYTVSIEDGISAVNSGMSLDGEIAASPAAPFPSGDGQPGGDAIWSFDVTGHPADMDNDGDFDAADRTIFVSVLLGLDTDASHIARSDFDGNGTVNGEDVAEYVSATLL